jgi:hypothetical protein
VSRLLLSAGVVKRVALRAPDGVASLEVLRITRRAMAHVLPLRVALKQSSLDARIASSRMASEPGQPSRFGFGYALRTVSCSFFWTRSHFCSGDSDIRDRRYYGTITRTTLRITVFLKRPERTAPNREGLESYGKPTSR